MSDNKVWICSTCGKSVCPAIELYYGDAVSMEHAECAVDRIRHQREWAATLPWWKRWVHT